MKLLLTITLIITSIFLIFKVGSWRDENNNNLLLNETKDKKNALEILEEMVNKYRSMNFYKSNGTTTYIEIYKGKSKELPRTDFNLTFESPNNFMLNWKDDDSEKVNRLMIDSQSSVLEVDHKVLTSYERINDAIFYVSSGDSKSRFFLLSLLAFNEKFVPRLKNVQRLNDETINNKSCYKIAARVQGVATDATANFTYWIEKDNFLIKRVEKQMIFQELEWTATEDYLEAEFR